MWLNIVFENSKININQLYKYDDAEGEQSRTPYWRGTISAEQ
jgi:hypothetical protein